MFKIIRKDQLNPNTYKYKIAAPLAAKKAKAGQFVIIRADESAERIPLTINDSDKIEGTVTVIFQAVGKSTMKLSTLCEGEDILDLAGPLGKPTEFEGVKRAAVVCGGLGVAISFPQAKALYDSDVSVDIIAGFRNKDLIILKEEMQNTCNNFYICTDDGSLGEKGLVTEKLKSLIENGAGYDAVFAVGPTVMMKYTALLTKNYGIKTIVSLNPIMVDGTGMCGCCRVTVDGEIKFACVDGPDFDGHKVDFDGLIKRLGTYREREKSDMDHTCRIGLDK